MADPTGQPPAPKAAPAPGAAPRPVPGGPPPQGAPAPQAGKPSVAWFQQAIKTMIEKKGSDLLLKVGRAPTVRVAGELEQMDMPPLTPNDLKALAETLMQPPQLKAFMETKEADYAIGVPGMGRFRVNTYWQRGTIAFAFRVIPYEVKTIQELKLPKILEEIALKPRGIVLVTGVTGSGKSTTLAAMINHINTNRRVNIITIEDPIEFLHRDINSIVNQREVGADTLSFHAALKHVLRQNPDVILIGEIRDQETMDIALSAADTGHLVFSTLHTTDATQTINRVISFYPPHQHEEVRHLLSTTLQAVVSQRLPPKKDGSGRVPAVEVLINTAAVRDNIRDVKAQLNIPDLIKEGSIQYGMQSFDQSLMRWFRMGEITLETALHYCTNPTEFSLQVQGIGGTSDRTFEGFEGQGETAPGAPPGSGGPDLGISRNPMAR
ncbi:MAG TPA: PilT/PilU family type 4a pilus ATPase [Gemmatimonadales bacterium]|nr:PilT/PilU family type 4a pilus ATPase [Gemmatimonadales bacterium]